MPDAYRCTLCGQELLVTSPAELKAAKLQAQVEQLRGLLYLACEQVLSQPCVPYVREVWTKLQAQVAPCAYATRCDHGKLLTEPCHEPGCDTGEL